MYDLSRPNITFALIYKRIALLCSRDDGLPKVGDILELSAAAPDAKNMRFEVISVDPRTGLMEARACEPNADGEHTLIRMSLRRLQ